MKTGHLTVKVEVVDDTTSVTYEFSVAPIPWTDEPRIGGPDYHEAMLGHVKEAVIRQLIEETYPHLASTWTSGR